VRDGGDAETAARALLSLIGVRNPSPDQAAGALLLGHGLIDLRIVALAHTKKE
jgi:hypothetical protein